MRTPDGSPIAGAFGWTWGGTCYIRYLFVAENMRGHGQGTMLMRAIQKEANSRDCRQIVLETFDFQAFAFYQKFGCLLTGLRCSASLMANSPHIHRPTLARAHALQVVSGNERHIPRPRGAPVSSDPPRNEEISHRNDVRRKPLTGVGSARL